MFSFFFIKKKLGFCLQSLITDGKGSCLLVWPFGGHGFWE